MLFYGRNKGEVTCFSRQVMCVMVFAGIICFMGVVSAQQEFATWIDGTVTFTLCRDEFVVKFKLGVTASEIAELNSKS